MNKCFKYFTIYLYVLPNLYKFSSRFKENFKDTVFMGQQFNFPCSVFVDAKYLTKIFIIFWGGQSILCPP